MSATLTHWRPLGMIEPFRKEIETLFDRFFGDEAGSGTMTANTWAPRIDVEETDKEIIVKADLPGVDPKAVDVSVQDGVLRVSGERKDERVEKKKNFQRVERFSGSFYRAISLPPSADADKMTAMSDSGVVTITVPKKAESQPKKVAVTAKA